MSATVRTISFNSRDEWSAAQRSMEEAVELKLDGTTSTVSNMESAILRIAENQDTNRQMLNAFMIEEERPVKRSLLAKAVDLSRRSRAFLPTASLGLRRYTLHQPQENEVNFDMNDSDDKSIPSCINIPACLSMTKRTYSIDERWEREYTYLHDFKLKTSDEPTPDWRSIYERDGLIPSNRPSKHTNKPTSTNSSKVLMSRNVLGKDRLGALACVTCVKGSAHKGEEMTGATESSGKVEKHYTYNDGDQEVNENWIRPNMYSF